MCREYSKTDSVLEGAFQAMIDDMQAEEAEILEKNRETLLKNMHEHISENKPSGMPKMAIVDLHVGSITINILSITSLLLNELAMVYIGTNYHILLAAAVFICSLVNAFEFNDSVELNKDGALVYCVLKQLADDKESGVIMVPKEKLVEQLAEESLDVDIDEALQLLRIKKLIAFKGNNILVSKVRTVALT